MAAKQLRRPACARTISISGSSAPDATASGTRSANIFTHAAAPGNTIESLDSMSSTMRDLAATHSSIPSRERDTAIVRQGLEQPHVVVAEVACVVIGLVQIDAVGAEHGLISAQVQRLAVGDDAVEIEEYGLELLGQGRRSPARIGTGSSAFARRDRAVDMSAL